jgi:hypothetical protein
MSSKPPPQKGWANGRTFIGNPPTAEGDGGLIHPGRGRPSNRAYPTAFKEAVLARYQERYADFGPTRSSDINDKLKFVGH